MLNNVRNKQGKVNGDNIEVKGGNVGRNDEWTEGAGRCGEGREGRAGEGEREEDLDLVNEQEAETSRQTQKRSARTSTYLSFLKRLICTAYGVDELILIA